MKKLTIAAAIVCAVAISNGASVNWSGAAAEAGPALIEDAPRNIYLVWSATAMSSLADNIKINGYGADAIGGTANNGGTIVAWHNYTVAEAATGLFADTFTRADKDGGVNGYYQILLADAANENFAVVNITDAVTGKSDSTGAGTVDYNGSWSEGFDMFIGKDGYTGTFATVGPVPEPTSGILLIIGVAGMALRRRRV